MLFYLFHEMVRVYDSVKMYALDALTKWETLLGWEFGWGGTSVKE